MQQHEEFRQIYGLQTNVQASRGEDEDGDGPVDTGVTPVNVSKDHSNSVAIALAVGAVVALMFTFLIVWSMRANRNLRSSVSDLPAVINPAYEGLETIYEYEENPVRGPGPVYAQPGSGLDDNLEPEYEQHPARAPGPLYAQSNVGQDEYLEVTAD